MFFKQHQILIKTATAVQASHSLLLTEAMQYLHTILNKAGSLWHHYQHFSGLLSVLNTIWSINPAW